MITLSQPEGATALDPDEMSDLIPGHISMQSQLNEWEQENILNAENWSFSRRHKDLLTIAFVLQLHRKMLDKTWRWAGKFRGSEKNIGANYSSITSELKKLLDDVIYQISQQTYSPDEIAYRFHHRLVSIHPFANGNGRHARLMTDILLVELKQPRFSWGRDKLGSEGLARKAYINALKAADKYDYQPLANFVRL